MAAVLGTQPYARPGGLATAFRGSVPVAVPVAGAAAALACAMAWRPLAGGVSVAAAAVAAVAVTAFARRRIGGFTGDVLGAAGVVAETVGLVVAAARW